MYTAVHVANAQKAQGAIITVDAENFQRVVRMAEAPLVVHGAAGIFSSKHAYVTSYRGLTFYTKVPKPLTFSAGVEMIEADRVSIPEV